MGDEKPFGMWLVDSGGRHSFHKNEPNLTFDQSFIGSLSFNRETEVWAALDKEGNELGSGTLHRVRTLLETHGKATEDIRYTPAPRKK